MPVVKMPDGRKIKFPDSMTPQQIQSAIESEGTGNSGGGFVGTAQGSRKLEEVARDVPRIAGAGLGALALSPFGPGATVAGAIGGGAIGESISAVGDIATKSEKAPKSVDQFLTRATFAGAQSGIEELAGYGAFKVARKVIAPFGRTVTEEGKIAQRTLQKYMPKRKPALTPAEMTEHWGLDVLDNIASKSYIGGKTMADFRNITRPTAINAMIEDMVAMFSHDADPVALGNLVTDVAKGEWKRYRNAVIDPLYNSIDARLSPTVRRVPVTKSVETGLLDKSGKPVMRDVFSHYDEIETGGVAIDLKPLKAAVEPQYRKIKKLPPVEQDHSGDHLVSGIMKMNNEVDFLTAVELRKRLIAASDRLSVENKKAPAIGLAKHLTGKLDDLISSTLKVADPDAYSVWRTANKLWKEGSKQFNNRFIRTLIRQADPDKGMGKPEQVLKTIFQKGNISGIRRTRDAIGDDAWHQVKGWYVRQMLTEATDTSGVVSGNKFFNNMFGPRGMTERAMKEIFTAEEISLLRNNAITIGVVQARQAAGAGGMMIQLAQPAAFIGVATGRFTGPSAAIIVGPEVAARLFTWKPFVDWATNAYKLSPKTGVAAATAARLAGFADQMKEIIEKEKEKF